MHLQGFRYHFNGRNQRGTKKPLDDGERGVKKQLNTQHSKIKIMATCSIASWQIHGEKVETMTHFRFLLQQQLTRYQFLFWLPIAKKQTIPKLNSL